MLEFKANGAADLADRLAAGLFAVLAILFGAGALAVFFFKSALFPA